MRRLVVLVLCGMVLSGCGLFRPAPVTPPRQRCVATIGTETASLDLEQSRNAAIIAGVATQRGLSPRAVSIALATAFQESDIRNIDYGDRDSIGLFQQRPSQGWGTVQQIMDPHYSTGKFYDALVKVKGWETGDINDVAQAVQRSGVPDGYRKHVERAKLLASALSGETPAAWSCLVREPPSGDLATFQTMLTKTYGKAATFTPQPGTPAVASVVVTTDAAAWSVAAFAQSWTSGAGVTTVSYNGMVWSVKGDALAGWAAAPTPAPVTARTVTVQLG